MPLNFIIITEERLNDSVWSLNDVQEFKLNYVKKPERRIRIRKRKSFKSLCLLYFCDIY